MNCIVRKGLREDMSAVLKLIQELAVFENEPDAVEVTENDLLRDGFGDVPKFHVFVAEVEGKIKGMALFYYRYSTWKGPTIHLEDLIVNEKFRGVGIGSCLYNEVMRFAFAKKVKRVDWDVLDWNNAAIAFYNKSGATVLKEWNAVKMYEKDLLTYIEKIGS